MEEKYVRTIMLPDWRAHSVIPKAVFDQARVYQASKSIEQCRQEFKSIKQCRQEFKSMWTDIGIEWGFIPILTNASVGLRGFGFTTEEDYLLFIMLETE
jgi:hypothetical protein